MQRGMIDAGEVTLLANRLSKLKGIDTHWRKSTWVCKTPALGVIGCVLSLNTRWHGFVRPRLDAFAETNPHICSVTDLQAAMRAQKPLTFVRQELNYNHSDRARVLKEITDWMVTISGDGSCRDQFQRLRCWARKSRPTDLDDLHIKGFALAGFQFMRMAFHANTTKPDTHVIGFVKDAIKRKPSPKQALELLELAAKEANVKIRNADSVIWDFREKKKHLK